MTSPVFSISPFYAATDKSLGHAAHRLLTVLCGFADKEGVCFPSRKMLTHLTGFDNSNLSKYIKALCRKGYLEQINDAGNRYKITGFKDKQWPMVACNKDMVENQQDGNSYHDGNNYHLINQENGNSYHDSTKNQQDGNSYHEYGNDYHEDGNSYHKTGESVVMITNRTDQVNNRPLEQTKGQINVLFDLESKPTGTESVKLSAKKTKPPKNPYSEEFEELWATYPSGSGGVKPNKKGAFHSFNARRNEGVEFSFLKTCVTNYRAKCDLEGKTGGNYVLNASTFFGPSQRYLEYQTQYKPQVIQNILPARRLATGCLDPSQIRTAI